jgi:hypothetical protein
VAAAVSVEAAARKGRGVVVVESAAVDKGSIATRSVYSSESEQLAAHMAAVASTLDAHEKLNAL